MDEDVATIVPECVGLGVGLEETGGKVEGLLGVLSALILSGGTGYISPGERDLHGQNVLSGGPPRSEFGTPSIELSPALSSPLPPRLNI